MHTKLEQVVRAFLLHLSTCEETMTAEGSGSWEQHTRLDRKDVQQ